jgi:hypothetical protein
MNQQCYPHPTCSPQMIAAKPRSGLCSLGDLMTRLVRLYELQNELEETPTRKLRRSLRRASQPATTESAMPRVMSDARQATFGFYECEV